MPRPSRLLSGLLSLSLALGLSTALPESKRAATSSSSPPTATLKSKPNTIFVGRSLSEFDQDVFLGIKYADKPVRFTPAELKTSYSANDSDSGSYDLSLSGLSSSSGSVYYNATEYGYDCPGYGSDDVKLEDYGWARYDENCQNLNIVRPIGQSEELLPVMIWILGGGWQQGATADPRYNLSYVVQQGASNGKPVVGVSINYRLAAFGFLDSTEVRASGNSNLGLRDQRTAMQWVKQNIKAFGGDPDKITIWGESAGAYSVGAHLVAYGGENDGLFRAAIMESGNAVGPPYNGTDWYQPMYNKIVNLTGCSNSSDTLECLREVPYEALYDVAYQGLEWFAVVDGDFIQQYPQISYNEGKIAKVPILLGANTDEGVSFGTSGVNTDEDAIQQLISSKRWVLDQEQATELLSHYPNISALGCPYGWGNVTWPKLGYEYKRYESMAGDLCMVAPRRLLANTMSKYEQNVYSYRWDAPLYNDTTTIGVYHFSEIPYVFANPVQNITSLGAQADPQRLYLGQMAARMWTSFATDLDPNGHGVSDIPQWPKYSKDATNFVFRLPRNGSYVEKDTFRATGIDYINTIVR